MISRIWILTNKIAQEVLRPIYRLDEFSKRPLCLRINLVGNPYLTLPGFLLLRTPATNLGQISHIVNSPNCPHDKNQSYMFGEVRKQKGLGKYRMSFPSCHRSIRRSGEFRRAERTSPTGEVDPPAIVGRWVRRGQRISETDRDPRRRFRTRLRWDRSPTSGRWRTETASTWPSAATAGQPDCSRGRSTHPEMLNKNSF